MLLVVFTIEFQEKSIYPLKKYKWINNYANTEAKIKQNKQIKTFGTATANGITTWLNL